MKDLQPLEDDAASIGDTALGGKDGLGGIPFTFSAEASFLPNKLYSVIAGKSIGGFELILLHNPWNESQECWTGQS
jgi:hypothetical protein